MNSPSVHLRTNTPSEFPMSGLISRTMRVFAMGRSLSRTFLRDPLIGVACGLLDCSASFDLVRRRLNERRPFRRNGRRGRANSTSFGGVPSPSSFVPSASLFRLKIFLNCLLCLSKVKNIYFLRRIDFIIAFDDANTRSRD